MLHDVLSLMHVLRQGILTAETLADQALRIANIAADTGHMHEAEGFRVLARKQRIRAMEGQGQLAVLEAEYGLVMALMQRDPDDDATA